MGAIKKAHSRGGCCWSRDRTGEEPGRALGETCVEPEDSRKAPGPCHVPGPPVNLPLLHVRILGSEEVKGHAQGWKGIEAGI